MRIGVLGGSFDPPHLGHLVLADQCATVLELDRVLFIPAFRPPHKLDREQTPFAVRARLVRAAVAGHPRFDVSDIEGERGGVSFTVETLRALRETNPSWELWLLMGEDSLDELEHWRHPAALARLAKIAVYHRESGVEKAPPAFAEQARFVSGPRIDVSSSELRRRLRAGESVRYLIPRAALEIVTRERLYRLDSRVDADAVEPQSESSV